MPALLTLPDAPDAILVGVGSKGIRRRKPARHLPPVRTRLPYENDLIPPNIMWPEAGSGFEADPYSPAGTAQRGWWMISALSKRQVRTRRLLALPILGFFVWGLVEFVVHLIQAL